MDGELRQLGFEQLRKQLERTKQLGGGLSAYYVKLKLHIQNILRRNFLGQIWRTIFESFKMKGNDSFGV